jgi:hypothetical protein
MPLSRRNLPKSLGTAVGAVAATSVFGSPLWFVRRHRGRLARRRSRVAGAGFARVHIAEKISHNRFKIAGGAAGPGSVLAGDRHPQRSMGRAQPHRRLAGETRTRARPLPLPQTR